MFVAKQVADLITYTRATLGVLLVWLGVAQGRDALSFVAVLMLFDWIGDCTDGYFARRSRVQYRTWIGDHDLEVDIFVSIGLLIYLYMAGYFSIFTALAYIAAWLLIFWRFGFHRSLGMLVQAPIYFLLIAVSLRDAHAYGLVLVAWIAIVIVLTWPRFPNEVIPGFLSGIRGILKR